MGMHLDTQELMEALARLKDIPLAKVVRNAARDYVQGAYRATPTAQTGKAKFYKAEKDGRTWYIPVAQTNGRRIRNLKKSGAQVRKLAIKKGWSKATWIGAMRELGMEAKARPKRLPDAVEAKSVTAQREGDTPSITITDQVRIDRFGRSTTDAAYSRISGEGFALAAQRMSKEYTRMIKGAWHR